MIAHAGHWLVNLLYALPVVVVGGMLGWQVVKDRRAQRRARRAGGGTEPSG